MGREACFADGVEILGWGEIAKGLVRPVVVEAAGKSVDEFLYFIESGR